MKLVQNRLNAKSNSRIFTTTNNIEIPNINRNKNLMKSQNFEGQINKQSKPNLNANTNIFQQRNKQRFYSTKNGKSIQNQKKQDSVSLSKWGQPRKTMPSSTGEYLHKLKNAASTNYTGFDVRSDNQTNVKG